MPLHAAWSKPQKRAIVVMGVSGSGKSTLAAGIAERLGCTFLEGDSFHPAANVAKMRAGEPLDDADRWPWLDRLAAAIDEAIRAEGVAVAACSALRRCYRDRLRNAIHAPVLFVLPEADRDELVRRMSNRPHHYMPASLLDSQIATLERPDPEEEALLLPCTLPPARMVGAVADWLAGRNPDR